jgi:uncharacterized protein with PIN domain
MRPRFLADCNVGRLARWLRALGYDAEYRPHLSDAQLVQDALAEDRVLLTRDVDLMQRRVVASGLVRTVFVRDDDVRRQLRQLVAELRLDRSQALTRCLECNLELVTRTAGDVAARVPPYVRATQNRYSECPQCARVYWAGTHWSRMHSVLDGLSAAEPA